MFFLVCAGLHVGSHDPCTRSGVLTNGLPGKSPQSQISDMQNQAKGIGKELYDNIPPLLFAKAHIRHSPFLGHRTKNTSQLTWSATL